MLTESDTMYLKYFNRIAKFFAHSAIHEKLTLEIENPKETFLTLGQLFIDTYLEKEETPDFETKECDTFSVACYVLKEEGELESAVVDLYSLYRKGGVTEEEKEEFKELLREGKRGGRNN